MKKLTKSGRPLIGFTLDFEVKGSFSSMPHYAIRENYLTSVSSLGAIPLPLPHEVEMVADYLELIDGLLITGGGFDVPPEYYGEKTTSDKVSTKDKRTEFEFAITRGAIEQKMPVLGICGGEQLINVALGGSLIQHIPDSYENPLEHEQKNARTEPGHEITIVPDSLLHKIVGVEKAAVNSAHHQSVAKPAPGTIINSSTSDGVVEGIEMTDHPFCLGVQWHPEYYVSPIDKKIFEAFVAACQK